MISRQQLEWVGLGDCSYRFTLTQVWQNVIVCWCAVMVGADEVECVASESILTFCEVRKTRESKHDAI